jgi:hypothetical protein
VLTCSLQMPCGYLDETPDAVSEVVPLMEPSRENRSLILSHHDPVSGFGMHK